MKQELRLIVTQSCNYNCYFCHHEGINELKKNLMSCDDIKYLYKVANKYLGIETVTITGGEPLLLNNIVDVTKKLYFSGCKTTIVTNGSLLDKKLDIGKYIDKLNISLHSLNKDEYEKIVGKERTFDTVISNIYLFRNLYPDVEINLNYALIKKDNVFEETKNIIDFCRKNNINVKFIELFPKTSNDFLPLELLHNNLIKNDHILLKSGMRKNKFSNTDKSFIYTTKCLCSRALDFDSPSKFCHDNNDLFLSQDGSIKLCRILDDEVKILDEIKERDDEALVKKLKLSFSMLGNNCPYQKK